MAAFTDFMNRFVPWAEATYPCAVREAMPGGDFRYDEVSAQIWLELLVAWKDYLKTGVTNLRSARPGDRAPGPDHVLRRAVFDAVGTSKPDGDPPTPTARRRITRM